MFRLYDHDITAWGRSYSYSSDSIPSTHLIHTSIDLSINFPLLHQVTASFSSISSWDSAWKNVPFWDMRGTETQISLCIHTVSSESSLSAWRNFAALAIQNAPIEDYDQTARMRRLTWIFAERTYLKVHFLTLKLKLSWLSDLVLLIDLSCEQTLLMHQTFIPFINLLGVLEV